MPYIPNGEKLLEPSEVMALYAMGERNFTQLNFRSAVARGRLAIPYADLRNSDFSGAQMQGADLRETDLRGSNLAGDFAGATFHSANLAGCRLDGNYRDCNFGSADLTEAWLSGYFKSARFLGARLLRASLKGSRINLADFLEAEITLQQIRDASSIVEVRLPNGETIGRPGLIHYVIGRLLGK